MIVASRNEERCLEAVKRMNDSAKKVGVENGCGGSGCGMAIFLGVLDLSSFQSVKDFASSFNNRFEHLNVLVNNAGINTSGISVDGYDLCYQSNFLGHFLLTNLLIKKLMKAENVTSDGRRGKYYQGDIFIP